MPQSESSLAKSLECSICTNQMSTAVALVPCMHHYCEECITTWRRTKTTCPQCRQPVIEQYRSHLIDEIINGAEASAANETVDHMAVVLEAAESAEMQLALEESNRATRNEAAKERERQRREDEMNMYQVREIDRRSSERAAYEREEAERRRKEKEEWDVLEASRRAAEKEQHERSEEERRHRERMEWDMAEMTRRMTLQPAAQPAHQHAASAVRMPQQTPAAPAVGQPRQIKSRCRFWPDCTRGAECLFIHPSQPCKLQSMCPSPSTCLYLHPCMAGAACSTHACPLIHPGRSGGGKAGKSGKQPPRQPLQAPPSVAHPQQPCKHKGACRNQHCKFSHPPECRFGESCSRDSCTFSHHRTKTATATKQ